MLKNNSVSTEISTEGVGMYTGASCHKVAFILSLLFHWLFCFIVVLLFKCSLFFSTKVTFFYKKNYNIVKYYYSLKRNSTLEKKNIYI